MAQPRSNTWYVSKRVDAPARAVVTSFDRKIADLGVVAAGGAELTRLARRCARRDTTAPDRIAGGSARQLRLPGWLPVRVAVELEVEPWSRHLCELAMRPARARIMPDPDRYGRAAALVLEALRDILEDEMAPDLASDAIGRLRRAS